MNTLRQHPTGIAGVVAPALVVIAYKLGVELTVAEAAILIAPVVALVSYFTPRNK